MYKLLYDQNMEMSRLFSSAARYRILRTLSRRLTPIHLRALADLSDIPLRSAQLAAAALVRLDVIAESREGNRCMFVLNPRSGFADRLRRFFKDELQQEISMRAQKYHDAAEILERVHELRMLSWQEP